MCIELSYDVISENYLSFGINEKQLILQLILQHAVTILQHAVTILQHTNLMRFAFQRSIL